MKDSQGTAQDTVAGAARRVGASVLTYNRADGEIAGILPGSEPEALTVPAGAVPSEPYLSHVVENGWELYRWKPGWWVRWQPAAGGAPARFRLEHLYYAP